MIVVVDVGGSHTRFALTDGVDIKEVTKVDTAVDSQPVEWLAENIRQLSDDAVVDRVVLALPGIIRDYQLLRANNLQHWNGVNFSTLADEVQAEVVIVNDADLAGLGEAVFGAGQSSEIMAYFTISTGIGGARIVNQRIDSSTFGFEPSDQLINWDSTETITTVESAKIEQTYHQPTGRIEDVELRDELVKKIATGLYNCSSAWSVDTIVVNGPPVLESGWLWPALSQRLNNLFSSLGELAPNVVLSELKDDAALYGGVALVRGETDDVAGIL
jgi:glucokinase